MYGEITGIVPDSIAEELGIGIGDHLLEINGQKMEDLIDYRFLTADEEVDLLIEKPNGAQILFEVEKDIDEEIGLIFSANVFDGIRLCHNKCLFCFVDQLPPDCRKTLRVKDDDYRMSFLEGNFITCTNLTEEEIQRIIRLGLSPLYLSVHCTDDEMRRYLLGNKKAQPIMPLLRRLTEAGIDIHAQIVLCPGLNDGAVLEKTITDLETLMPGICSLAIVPVGLTAYQKNNLRLFRKEEAAALIPYIAEKQSYFWEKWGTHFVYLADEFYFIAEAEFPPYDTYEEFPQLENGIGLTPLMWAEFWQIEPDLPASLPQKREVTIATGKSGYLVLQPILKRLQQIENLHVNCFALENKFFGPTITVTGLITGGSLISGLQKWRQSSTETKPLILISQSMLKFDSDVFLDGMDITEVEDALNAEIRPVVNDGAILAQEILGL